MVTVANRWVYAGTVSAVNVSFIGDANSDYIDATELSDADPVQIQGATANSLGITGQNYAIQVQPFDEVQTYAQTYYTDEEETLYWYRFVDRAVATWDNAVSSDRTINATSSCTELNITYGGYAGYQTNDPELYNWLDWIAQDGTPMSYWVDQAASGCTTWMTNMSSTCGPRCYQVYALQSADNNTVTRPRLWDCQAHVSVVEGVEYYQNSDVYRMPDFQAQLFAGAIGLSGFITTSQNDSSVVEDLQMVRYPIDSPWSPSSDYEAEDMARLLRSFTAGAISAFDENGPRMNVTGNTPGPAQVVNVKWKFSLLILAGVPGFQVLVLLLVIMFANKAIIKDTSHLSMARLLRPLVDKLGDGGCLLTGDEIAEKLGNVKIIYGVRDPGVGNVPPSGVGDTGEVRHIDILEETEGFGYRRGRMPVGMYDGIHPSRQNRSFEEEDGSDSETVGLLSDEGRASNVEAHDGDGMWWRTRPQAQQRQKQRQRRLSV